MAPAPAQGSSSAPHIVIFEPEATGHQMDFVRYLLDGIDTGIPRARVTLLTTQASAAHANCVRLVSTHASLLRIRVIPDMRDSSMLRTLIGRFYARQWQTGSQLKRGLRALAAEEAIDFVLIPHLESVGLPTLALRPHLLLGRRWATISVGIRFHHRQAGILGPAGWRDLAQRICFHMLLHRADLVCFGAVNPYLAQTVRHPKIAWCPEPAPLFVPADPGEARRFYGLRPDTLVILVFGFIDRRKCVGPLLDAIASLDESHDITVLLAGTQHAGHMQSVLCSPAAQELRRRGRLVEANRFIMSGRDIDPMNVADIVWVFYDAGFVFTGNVLARAARAGRAVIARNTGVIGRLVNDSGCGLVLSSEAPDIIAEAVLELARSPEERALMGMRGKAAFADHSPEAFAAPIVAKIAETLPAESSREKCD